MNGEYVIYGGSISLFTRKLEAATVELMAQLEWRRTDLGEMAQLALIESLTAAVAPQLPSLFGSTPGDVRDAVGRLAGGDRFAKLARECFA